VLRSVVPLFSKLSPSPFERFAAGDRPMTPAVTREVVSTPARDETQRRDFVSARAACSSTIVAFGRMDRTQISLLGFDSCAVEFDRRDDLGARR
jgi:hypothetical protein